MSDMKDIKMFFVEKQARDKNGQVIPDYNSLIELAKVWISQQALNIASDGVANGKAIITYSLAANTMLVITKLKVGCNAEQIISVGYGSALDGTQTKVDHIYLNGKQTWMELSDGKTPIIVINNTSSSAVNVYIYAPGGTVMGVANNPAAPNQVYYLAMFGGFLL
ncbi:MAG: hypothetical protein ACTSQJ_00275 [Promethearchaeota archaeon]